MVETNKQYEMFGGPLDGSTSPPPDAGCKAEHWYWQLKSSGRFAIYRWEGFRWKFVEVVGKRPQKWKQ